MKKLVVLISLLSLANLGFSQLSINGHFYGEDALKFSEINVPVGTARVAGMGGAFSSLGGDISSVYSNAAGLGFFNRSEFSISLGTNSARTHSTYINNTNSITESNPFFNHIGVVMHNTRNKRNGSFGISYNNLKSFNSGFNYTGSNNVSSIQDYFASVTNASGATVGDLQNEFDDANNIASTVESLYYYAYLIEPDDNGVFYPGELSLPVTQTGSVNESGNLGQITFAYGQNFNDSKYIGGSIGIQNLNYSITTDFEERFSTTDAFIRSFTYRDILDVSGTGINFSLGGIARVTDNVNLGVNLTSPTFMATNESLYTSINNLIITDPNIDYSPGLSVVPNDFNYSITSPFRGQLGLSIFLPKKVGVLSAEAEYVGYGGMNVYDIRNSDFANNQKSGIQNEFSNTLNLKGGAEIRLSNARLRAGLSYLSNPYKNIGDDKLVYSFGAGFRNQKFFIDASFSGFNSIGSFTQYDLPNTGDYPSVALDKQNNIFKFSVGTFF